MLLTELEVNDPMGEKEDQEGPSRPVPSRVAMRALVLVAVSCRGAIEQEPAGADHQELCLEICEWLEEVGAWQETESQEREVLESRLGTLSRRDRVDATWCSEGAAVLAWALGVGGLPSCHIPCDPISTASRVGFLADSDETVLEAPVLLLESRLQDCAKHYMEVHGRLRDLRIKRESIAFGSDAHTKMSFDDSLCVGGQRIDLSSIAKRDSVNSIVMERHRALNWLLGDESIYSEVTTDT